MTVHMLALIYAGLAALPACMHLALAMGAPLGHLTMGGRWRGRLPPRVRGLSILQAVLLGAMAAVVLQSAGLVAIGWPDWTIWPVLALTVMTCIANAISPSRPERLLWTPVIAGMCAAGFGVAFS